MLFIVNYKLQLLYHSTVQCRKWQYNLLNNCKHISDQLLWKKTAILVICSYIRHIQNQSGGWHGLAVCMANCTCEMCQIYTDIQLTSCSAFITGDVSKESSSPFISLITSTFILITSFSPWNVSHVSLYKPSIASSKLMQFCKKNIPLLIMTTISHYMKQYAFY
jgi:hypothetical protein